MRHIILEVSGLFGIKCDSCNSYTTTFKDNKGSIEFTKERKYRTQIKHISIKWHHFRKNNKLGTSKIIYIETNEKQAYSMKKTSEKPQLEYLRKQIMGW